MKPKILFILHFPPPTHGSAMVGKQIADSKLINESFDCDYINLSTSRSTDEIGKGGVVKYVRTLKIYLKTFMKLVTHKYDLCYLAITVTRAGLFKDAPLVFMCKAFNNVVLIHQHNKGVAHFQNKFLFNLVYKLIYRKTNIMLLSWSLYPDISRYVRRNEVCICPNGIPPLNITQSVGKEVSSVPQLLFLSNLAESKGCLILLDACKKLKNRGVRFQCHLVGGESVEISKEIFLNEIDLRGLTDCVLYHGPKYAAEKDYFFRKADIFVSPSFNDCFPLVLIEAMQYNLPVVSTFEGGIPDIVEDGVTGFLCNRKDSSDIAEKLESLITNEALRIKMGNAGNNRYTNHFSLDLFEKTFVKNIEAVRKNMLGINQ